MVALLCPRCQRANPENAAYCHFDGIDLRAGGGAGLRGGGDLVREFVFPSGRRCRTFDDLARGCSEEWTAAKNMLRQGSLRQFLAGIGRMDLALLADRSAAQPDLDIGLDQFLTQLPTREAAGPRLDLVPRRLVLGRLQVGESRKYQLTVLNQGTRLLHGTIQVEGGEWVRLVGGVNNSLPLKTGKQQTVAVQIDTLGLPAGQRYAAKLTVITNGGAVEVPITMELTALPFPQPPLYGITNPRDLAGRLKEVPKQGAPLLESGEVQRWFAANGWRYPVEGAPAKGVAAVQQFFEGMGLSKPPPVTVPDRQVLMACRVGHTVNGHVTLRTTAKKWVYARVESDSPWLTVANPDVGGAQQAEIEFTASGRGLTVGKKYEGRLTVTANGGQKFVITVTADIQPGRTTFFHRLLRRLVVGGLAGGLLRLLLSLPDLYARDWSAFGSLLHDPPRDYVRAFTLATAWLGIPVGALVIWRRSGWKDLPAGVVVGAVTGLAAGATLGCLLHVLDQPLWAVLPLNLPGSAVAAWGAVGAAAAAVVGGLGRWGRGVVNAVGRALGAAARAVRLVGLGDYLEGD
jgi:hypothetical protein